MADVALLMVTFCAVGLFGAEALSGNAPFAPLFPPFYLVYGTLYVLFLDYLVRHRVRSWTTVYLLGVLVGYVTESFAAKVMWFGWPDNAHNLGGILPWPELPLLAFFFHPLFSFALPVYFARRCLAYPLELRPLRAGDLLLRVAPAFPAFQVALGALDPSRQALFVTLDLLLIAGLATRLARRGALTDVRLRARARAGVLVALLATYVVAFFRMPPFKRSEVLLPAPHQVAFAFAFTAFVLYLVWRRTRHLADGAPVPYAPPPLPLGTVARAAGQVLGTMVVGAALLSAARPVAVPLWLLVFLTGTLLGTWFFFATVWRTLRRPNAPVAVTAGRG